MHELRVAALALITLLMPLRALARTVTITVTGTVKSGTDPFGYFGPAGGSIDGKPFILVFTFDDSTGQQVMANRACQVSCTSSNSGGGTATVRVGGSAPYAFGHVNSSVYKTIWPTGYQMMISVADEYDAVTVGIAGVQSNPPATRNPDWRAPFFDSHLVKTLAPIAQFTTANRATGGRGLGVLTPATICVGDSCSPAPDPCLDTTPAGAATLPSQAVVHSMKFHDQQGSSLCWAAVGQMLMENTPGGTFYDQCKVVGTTLSAGKPSPTDCCGPSGQPTCNVAGFASSALNAFKFRSQVVASLTQDQIKKEVACGRPVGANWQQITSISPFFGSHEVIIWGYSTDADGTLMLQIYDPFTYHFQGSTLPGIFRRISYDDFTARFGYSDPLTPSRLIERQFYYQVKPPL
jgi:hypothetical protein